MTYIPGGESCGVAQVKSKQGDLDGIVTFCELAIPLAARLCEHLGLPGNSPEAVDTARNKHSARACMERAGLPTPRNALIKAESDLAEAADHVGFPAVIKPISGAASIGVIRVDDREQLEKSFKRCAVTVCWLPRAPRPCTRVCMHGSPRIAPGPLAWPRSCRPACIGAVLAKACRHQVCARHTWTCFIPPPIG